MQMFMILIVLIFMDVSNEYKKVCNETRCSNFLYNFSGIYVIKRTKAGKILNIAFNCLGVVSVIVLFVSVYHLIKLCITPTICALEYIQNMM